MRDTRFDGPWYTLISNNNDWTAVLFSRKKNSKDLEEEVLTDDTEAVEDDDASDDLDDPDLDEGNDPDLDPEEEVELDQWAALDLSRDWREDGPFDISEVDLKADEVKRIDLGAVIITPEQGMRIKLVVDPTTGEVPFLIAENGPASSVQITALAAPALPGFCAEVRERLVSTVEDETVELVEGPFGTEIRRVLVVTDDKGRETMTPVRDWLVAGPRWVLNARLAGKAALDLDQSGAAAQLEEFVRNIIVRRGDEAMVPGLPLPLTPVEEK